MNKKLTYTELIKLIIPLWILALVFIYKKSFKETLDIKKELKSLENKLSSSSDISDKTNQLQKELNLLAGSNWDYNSDMQESILNLLSDYSIINTIQLFKYEKPITYEKANQQIILFDFEIEGDPINLVKFTKSLENIIGQKKISSLLIQSRKEANQQNYNTYARYIIQDVKTN